MACKLAPLSYPHLSHTEIFDSVEEFCSRFYFRLPKIAAIVSEMAAMAVMRTRPASVILLGLNYRDSGYAPSPAAGRAYLIVKRTQGSIGPSGSAPRKPSAYKNKVVRRRTDLR
jgi:hypothetical protein